MMLEAKRAEIKALEAAAAKHLREAETGEKDGVSMGCACNLVNRLRRVRRYEKTQKTDVKETAEAAAPKAAAAAAAVSSGGIRLFGKAKAKKSAEEGLAEAQAALQERIGVLEGRAAECRNEAKMLAIDGKRAQALRMLRRAKQRDAQLENLVASLDALQAHADVLESASLQTTIAAAVSSTSKKFKQSKSALSKAETAVEDGIGLKDLAEDLNAVMGELGSASNVSDDDEDLLRELDALIVDDAPPVPPAAERIKDDIAEVNDDIASIEARYRFPKAPVVLVRHKKRTEEKSRLLPEAQAR